MTYIFSFSLFWGFLVFDWLYFSFYFSCQNKMRFLSLSRFQNLVSKSLRVRIFCFWFSAEKFHIKKRPINNFVLLYNNASSHVNSPTSEKGNAKSFCLWVPRLFAHINLLFKVLMQILKFFGNELYFFGRELTTSERSLNPHTHTHSHSRIRWVWELLWFTHSLILVYISQFSVRRPFALRVLLSITMIKLADSGSPWTADCPESMSIKTLKQEFGELLLLIRKIHLTYVLLLSSNFFLSDCSQICTCTSLPPSLSGNAHMSEQ
jgi:hypothetical protein